MASKITEIYNYLVALMPTVWTSANLIPNFNDIGSAPSTLLQNGYSIGVGGTGEPTPGDLSYQERFTRTIFIARTIVQSPHETDETSVINDNIAMLEDHYLLRKALRVDNTLGTKASDIGYAGDGGIEALVIESVEGAGRYYVMTTSFSLTYMESML